MSERRPILLSAALFGGLAVAFGAFGAHVLRDTLEPVRLGWWNTAVQYQMWHALALLGLGVSSLPRRSLTALLLGSGIILFSGTLYVMALTGMRWLGAVTPIGGLLLIGGWLSLAWQASRRPQA